MIPRGALPEGFVYTGTSPWATRNSDWDVKCSLAELQVTEDARRAYKRRKELEADQEHWLRQNPQKPQKVNEPAQPKPEKPFVAYDWEFGWTQEAKEVVRKAIEDGLITKAGHRETELMLHRYSESQKLKMSGLSHG